MCIISNSHKFVFVHVPKSAGTSVSTLLSCFTGYSDIELGGTDYGEAIQDVFFARFGLKKHSPARAIRDVMGCDAWSRAFSFGFVRNPFDRCLSTYRFLRQWSGSGVDFFETMNGFSCFDEYVMSDLWDVSTGPDEIFRPQMFWLESREGCGDLCVDYVGKVENIDDCMAFILDTIGVSLPPGCEGGLPKLNHTDRGGCDVISDRRVIEKIVSRYRTDFEAFGYSLDPVG